MSIPPAMRRFMTVLAEALSVSPATVAAPALCERAALLAGVLREGAASGELERVTERVREAAALPVRPRTPARATSPGSARPSPDELRQEIQRRCPAWCEESHTGAVPGQVGQVHTVRLWYRDDDPLGLGAELFVQWQQWFSGERPEQPPSIHLYRHEDDCTTVMELTPEQAVAWRGVLLAAGAEGLAWALAEAVDLARGQVRS